MALSSLARRAIVHGNYSGEIMTRSIIYSPEAAPPIGPYSQAVKATGSFIFTSGQIPLNADGNMVDGDVSAQTHAVCANLKAILASSGAGFEHVVKTTVFLQDMNDFGAMNEVYKQYFTGDQPPARSTIQVARLPKDARVEIECVACVS
jgi:2-iminobutanoate/2-iminopropanoate deaminase